MTARAVAAVLVGLALVVVVAGGGGTTTDAEAVFQLLVVAAAVPLAFIDARRRAPAPWWHAPSAAATAAVAAGLAGALSAPHVYGSLTQWTRWAVVLLLAWCVARVLRGSADAERADAAWARLALSAGAGVVVLQVAGQLGHPLGGRGMERGGDRALGTFFDPNHMAATLALASVVLARDAGLGRGRPRLHAAVAFAAAVVALGSQSRVAPVALLLGLGAEAWRRWRLRGGTVSRRVVALAAAGALTLGAVAVGTVASRFGELDAWTRPTIWRAVAPAALERPVRGIGPGSFKHVHHAYNLPVQRGIGRYARRPSTPHGEWIRLPIELGLLGCAALAWLGWATWRSGRAGGRLNEAAPVAACAAPWLAVHDVLDSPAFAAWLAAALAAATTRLSCSSRRDEPPLGDHRPAATLAAGVALASLVSGLVVRPTLAVRARREAQPRALERALHWNGAQPAYWRTLAGWVAGEGEVDARRLATAWGLLAEAERLAPREPTVARDQARLAMRGFRDVAPDEASQDLVVRAYERALAVDSLDPFLAVEAAQAARLVGRPDVAGGWARQALALEPWFTRARVVLVLAARDAGDEEAAARARTALLEHLREIEERTLSMPYERVLVELDQDDLAEAVGPAG